MEFQTSKKIHIRPNLSEAVYEVIKEWLVNETLETGAKIKEGEIAKQLGVSRTPVREAIHKLEREGLVEIIPRYGTFVASIFPKDIQEIYDIRGALETLALKSGFLHINKKKLLEMKQLHERCEEPLKKGNLSPFLKMDAKFHDFIIKASGNRRLAQLMGNLKTQIRVSKLESLSVPGRAEKSLEEHKNIISAMLEEDEKKAEKLLKEHTNKAKKNLLHLINERQHQRQNNSSSPLSS